MRAGKDGRISYGRDKVGSRPTICGEINATHLREVEDLLRQRAELALVGRVLHFWKHALGLGWFHLSASHPREFNVPLELSCQWPH